MYRLLAIPIVFVASAAVSGTAIAQAAPRAITPLPECNIRGARDTLKSGGAPNFQGCFIGEAVRVLTAADYQVRQVTDEVTTGVERGRITWQSRDGRLFVLRVSSGRGFPPAPPPTGRPRPRPPSTQEPTSPPEPVVFTIAGTSNTVEGGDLVFRILRRGNDGNRYRVALAYNAASLLENPPTDIIVGPSEPVTQLRLRTVAGPDEEGTRLVVVRLAGASTGATIGSKNSARGVIEDAVVAPASYSIRPDGIVNRGEAVRFVVSRTGPLAESDVEYGIGQGNVPVGAVGARRMLHFAEGSTARPITVLPTVYDPCGAPVNVTLLGAASESPSAIAAFTELMPPECEAAQPTPQPTGSATPQPGPSPTATPEPKAKPNWALIDMVLRWWPALAVIGLSILGFIARTLKRWWDRKKALAAKLTGHEPAAKPQPVATPVQPLTAACRMETGISELLGDEEKMQVWPGFRARVTIERGMASVPDPLPITEEPNG